MFANENSALVPSSVSLCPGTMSKLKVPFYLLLASLVLAVTVFGNAL